jgi:hypothetical protein
MCAPRLGRLFGFVVDIFDHVVGANEDAGPALAATPPENDVVHHVLKCRVCHLPGSLSEGQNGILDDTKFKAEPHPPLKSHPGLVNESVCFRRYRKRAQLSFITDYCRGRFRQV